MRTMLLVCAITFIAACGQTSDAPTCQQAVSHYYAAGCALFRTNGMPIPELEVIESCKQLLATAPDPCVDDLADLRSCLGGVPLPSASNADCDCSEEQDAILTCE